MWQNSIFPSFLACSLMVLETNLVDGKAIWLDMFNTLVIFTFLTEKEGVAQLTPIYAQLTPPSIIETFYNKMCRQIADSSFAVWTRFLWVSWYVCPELRNIKSYILEFVVKYVIDTTRGYDGCKVLKRQKSSSVIIRSCHISYSLVKT